MQQIVIENLVKAYRTMAKVAGHPEPWRMGDEIHKAIVTLQLFGSEAVVDRTVAWIERTMKQGNVKTTILDDLLEALRYDLRHELGLKAISGKIWWVNIGPPKEPGP